MRSSVCCYQIRRLRTDPIREQLEYGGPRLRTTATLASIRIPITVDIGFGDAVEPGVEEVNPPVLLDLPAPASARVRPGDGRGRKIPSYGGAWKSQLSGERLP